MEYCTKCGAKLTIKVDFCTKCGNPIKTTIDNDAELKNKKSVEKKIEEAAEEFGKRAEKFGKEFGKRAEVFGRKADQIGKKIEKRADDVGYYFNHWYDSTFKFGGPLIGAFIGLIVIRLIIYLIDISGEDIFIFSALGEGLYEYLLIIFVSMLLSGYNTYIYRKYKLEYQWIYPFISSVSFILGAWITAQIMIIISQSNNTPIIGAIGIFIDTYLIGIFVLVIIIAYGVQYASISYSSNEK